MNTVLKSAIFNQIAVAFTSTKEVNVEVMFFFVYILKVFLVY